MTADAKQLVHDVVVVGGGAAGLAAATWLGRYRRDTVVVDSGDYRAASVELSHGDLGPDPQHPLDLLATARKQLAAYQTVRVRAGRVDSVRSDDWCFTLTLDDGSDLRAARVVLATGVVDACPDIDGFDRHHGACA